MAGQMGSGGATVKNSVVIAVDSEKNLLFVKGGVPGAAGSLLKVTSMGVKGVKKQFKITEYKHE